MSCFSPDPCSHCEEKEHRLTAPLAFIAGVRIKELETKLAALEQEAHEACSKCGQAVLREISLPTLLAALERGGATSFEKDAAEVIHFLLAGRG